MIKWSIRFVLALIVCLVKIAIFSAKIALYIALKLVMLPAWVLWGNSTTVYKFRKKNYGRKRK